MRRNQVLVTVALVFLPAAGLLPARTASAQTDGVLQVDDDIHHFLFRQQTTGLLDFAFLTSQPLAAHVARAMLDSLATRRERLSFTDQRILDKLRGAATWRTTGAIRDRVPFVYANGVDFFSSSGDGYRFQLNPLLNARVGRAWLSGRGDGDERVPVWQSTRGVRASGSFLDAVFFEARVEENQRRVVDARYDPDRKTAPRLGKANFDADRNVLDYLVATGVVGYRSRFVEVRFGRDRNRWGPAVGAIGLSNFATVFDQLQIRTTFGPVQYTNVFASLATGRVQESDSVIPKKYASMHRLSVQLPYRVELALYESVIFATDSLGARKSFDIAYLNPVIFLRAVEADRGSPDNVLLGGSASWVAYPGYRVYAGILLDELRVSQIGKSWWANKWAVQWGAHFVPHPSVDIRAEYTRLRPYLYAHREPLNAMVHYDDGLGHPAGPNAIDLLVALNARASDRLSAAITFYQTVRGRDSTGTNFGADPRLPNGTRTSDEGVDILQGVRQRERFVEVLVSYEFLPRLYGDVSVAYVEIDDAVAGLDRYVRPFVGLRWGLVPLSDRY